VDEDLQAITEMRAVTISREYGSGGGEIAARLARRLGWTLVNHQVIAQRARELGTSDFVLQAHDKETGGIFERILQWPYPVSSADKQACFATLCRVVKAAADDGHAVIVGRGGQVLHAARRDVLHIRVVAPLEHRVAYVGRREGLDWDAATTRTHEKDRARTRYMRAQFHCEHDDPHLYDLVINTAVLDLDSAVEQIRLALVHKAGRLSVPKEAIGPEVGMERYLEQPLDFPVPRASLSR
jgi:CMP/dCMP kinase